MVTIHNHKSVVLIKPNSLAKNSNIELHFERSTWALLRTQLIINSISVIVYYYLFDIDRDIFSTRFTAYDIESDRHILWIWRLNCFSLWIRSRWTFSFISDHIFLIGLASGDWEGQLKVVIPLFFCHVVHNLLRCFGSLSSWMVHSWLMCLNNLQADVNRPFSFNRSIFGAFKLRVIRHNLPKLRILKHPRTWTFFWVLNGTLNNSGCPRVDQNFLRESKRQKDDLSVRTVSLQSISKYSRAYPAVLQYGFLSVGVSIFQYAIR